MRKLVYAINVTADGRCDHTLFNPTEEELAYFTALTRQAEVLLYGRKTYELMIPYWPEAAKNPEGQTQGEIDFAQAFVGVPRTVVFSTTLSETEDTNTTIARGDLREEIQKLKQGDGKNILVGGISLPSELIELGLIDELHLLVSPIISCKGRQLFEGADLNSKIQLTLSSSHVFQSGCVALHYLNSTAQHS